LVKEAYWRKRRGGLRNESELGPENGEETGLVEGGVLSIRGEGGRGFMGTLFRSGVREGDCGVVKKHPLSRKEGRKEKGDGP